MKNIEKTEYRCIKCDKLLMIGELSSAAVEIKCSRCKHINFFFDNESDQIVITDIDGVVLYANKALSERTGYSIEEIVFANGASPAIAPKELIN